MVLGTRRWYSVRTYQEPRTVLINIWLTFIKYRVIIIIVNVFSIYYVADTILNTWQVLIDLNLKTTLEERMVLTQSFERLINWAIYYNADTG